MALREVPGRILANKGVPVPMYALERLADGRLAVPFTRVETQAGEAVVEEVFVKMTNLALADIEESFGSLQAWQQDLQAKPFGTLITTLALCLEQDRRAVGLSMVDGTLEDYSTAVGVAFMLANGVAPEKAGEILARGVRAAAAARGRIIDQGLEQLLEQERAKDGAETETGQVDAPSTQPAPTPGMSSSEHGSASDETTTSSGG